MQPRMPLRNIERLESRQLLTTTPIWDDPVIVETDINEVIYVEGADISGDGVTMLWRPDQMSFCT